MKLVYEHTKLITSNILSITWLLKSGTKLGPLKGPWMIASASTGTTYVKHTCIYTLPMWQTHVNWMVIYNFHEHENTDMYSLKTTEHTHFSSSFLNHLLLNTCTLLCKLTRPVNEHPNFCKQPRGVQIQNVMTTKLWIMVPNISGSSISNVLHYHPVANHNWDSSYICSIAVHPCYPTSFLPLLARRLLPSSKTSSLDPTNIRHFL
jgi:hypothetical protein